MINRILAKLISHLPEEIVWIFSKKYIAGKKLSDAIQLSQKFNSQNIVVTIDILGENVRQLNEIVDSKKEYLKTIQSISLNKVRASISLKPTMFGLLIDYDFCVLQIKEIVEAARNASVLVCIDMEDSSCTNLELKLFKELYASFPGSVTLVLQAYLKRTVSDIQDLVKLNSPEHSINIRLCKGIYVEPEEIAYKSKKEVNRNYNNCLELLVKNHFFCAIATHDNKLIGTAKKIINKYNLPRSSYEFQMLLGVKPALRNKLVSSGHPVRIYVPYGTFWFAYSTRRLKENPKMIWHIIKSLLFHG